MELFDSHSHYNDERFNEDRDFMIQENYNKGITKTTCVRI
jgi:Tat protein secretion system quality control protein TatD with DNase activity